MRVVAKVLFIIFLLWVVYGAYFLVNFQPTISASWGDLWGEKGRAKGSIFVNINLGNPSPIPIKVENLKIRVNDITVGSAENFGIGFLREKLVGNLTIDFWNLTDALISHIENNERSIVELSANIKLFNIIPYNYSITREVDFNVLSYFSNITVPSKKYSGLIISVYTPAIEGIDARWGEVTQEKITIIAKIKLYNPNDFLIVVDNLEGYIYVNGFEFGYARIIEGATIRGKSRGEVVVEITTDEIKLYNAIVSHIENGCVSDVKLDIKFHIGSGGFYGWEVKVPLKDVHTRIEFDPLAYITSP
ncbi:MULTISPECIES: LEA type 2 family protein [Pyrococcus]|nr:LEA type 2 family protein [Pyrococcus furiosus]AFN04445.1 hypothetical protein PFC_07545 [Pyrococcus furiosus COM1]